ncbi:RibD family protein [Nocardia sp. NPDC057353]|uniref:RibD family protein n=1 Tax=Nocardia sp. NPDC057353 TaxID=3346104 RepID=UPI00362FC860
MLLSVAMSVDGYIDDATSERLLLSNAEDFDRIDQVRAESDAILVGAGTLRADNPRLIVRSGERQEGRVVAGRTRQPRKVTVTGSGDLDPEAKFWHHGTSEQRPVVYTTENGAVTAREQLGDLADVVALGATVDLEMLLDDLGARGVQRLMVEGGSHMHTAFLAGGLADQLDLAIGPVLVGDPAAPRFLGPAAFPGGSLRRMRLAGVEQIGDVALLRYRPKEGSSGE